MPCEDETPEAITDHLPKNDQVTSDQTITLVRAVNGLARPTNAGKNLRKQQSQDLFLVTKIAH